MIGLEWSGVQSDWIGLAQGRLDSIGLDDWDGLGKRRVIPTRVCVAEPRKAGSFAYHEGVGGVVGVVLGDLLSERGGGLT